MKKGDLSINIIVVAAIAMLILVIISVLVFRAGTGVTEGTSCEGLGGVCTTGGCGSDNWDLDDGRWIRHPTAKCFADSEVCCIRQ